MPRSRVGDSGITLLAGGVVGCFFPSVSLSIELPLMYFHISLNYDHIIVSLKVWKSPHSHFPPSLPSCTALVTHSGVQAKAL